MDSEVGVTSVISPCWYKAHLDVAYIQWKAWRNCVMAVKKRGTTASPTFMMGTLHCPEIRKCAYIDRIGARWVLTYLDPCEKEKKILSDDYLRALVNKIYEELTVLVTPPPYESYEPYETSYEPSEAPPPPPYELIAHESWV